MSELSKIDLEQLAEKGRRSLFFLARGILGMKDLTVNIHKPICDALQSNGSKRDCLIVPRDWFKSSIGSIAYPIWLAINNPNVRILIAQNSFNNACKKLNNISEIFEKNQLFRVLYQDILPDSSCTWNRDCLTVKRLISAPEGTFEAAGTGTAVTSRHYDVVIEDDTVAPEKDALTGQMAQPTKLELEKAITWHKLVHPLLIDPKKSKIVIIGTRWAPNDLLGYIIQHCPEYNVITRTVREKDGKPCSKADGGKAIWDRFDEEVLDQLERDLGPYIFSSLYMNNPTEAANATFKRDWIQYYVNLPSEPLLYITSADPTPYDDEMTEDPDYGVVVTVAINPRNLNIYVVNYDRDRYNPGEFINRIFFHNRAYKPIKVKMEGVAYQRTLKYWTDIKQKALNEFFYIDVVKSLRGSKVDRISGLQPFFANGKVFIKPSMKELENELILFPSPRTHDDIIDALSLQMPDWNDCRQANEKVEEEKLSTNIFSGFSIIEDIKNVRGLKNVDSKFDTISASSSFDRFSYNNN